MFAPLFRATIGDGPEFISGTMMECVERQGARLKHIKLSKPQKKAYIKRYNRTVRGEYLGQFIFETIEWIKIRQLNGSGLTTTIDPTWASAASHPL